MSLTFPGGGPCLPFYSIKRWGPTPQVRYNLQAPTPLVQYDLKSGGSKNTSKINKKQLFHYKMPGPDLPQKKV